MEQKRIKTFSIVIIGYWLLHLAYLPPFAPTPNFNIHTSEAIQEIIQDLHPEFGKSSEEQAETLKREYYRHTTKYYSLILMWVITGILLYFRRRSGQVLALALAGVVLVLKLWPWLTSYPHTYERAYGYFTMFLPSYPFTAIHNDLIGIAICLFTIFFLLNKRNSELFTKKTI